jgi:hypothetical protein
VSKNLLGLSAYREEQLKRLSVNARLPAEVLGRVDSTKAVAGIAMSLAFGPLRSLNSEMRLVRKMKHALLLKMAVRMAIAGQAFPRSGASRGDRARLLPAGRSGGDHRAGVEAACPARIRPSPSRRRWPCSIEAGLSRSTTRRPRPRRIKAQSFERAVQLLDAPTSDHHYPSTRYHERVTFSSPDNGAL